ncbi:HPr family phosphocarrier protein, partial [Bacteroides thetaiotaomicron]
MRQLLAAEITVQNLLGLHARPIAKLVKTLSGCSDRVTLKGAERSADAQD